MQRTLAFLLTSLALLVSWTPALPASDPGIIGLGLDKLHMHMTMEEARRAYPGLIDGSSNHGWFSLRNYRLEKCEFSVDLLFTNNGLTIMDLETREPVAVPLGIDVCKPAILNRLEEQYGAPEYGASESPWPSPSAAYFRSNDGIAIKVRDGIGRDCGLVDGARHLSIVFVAPDAPVIIC